MSQIIESVWLFDEKYRRYGHKKKQNSEKFYQSVIEQMSGENKGSISIIKETKIKKIIK